MISNHRFLLAQLTGSCDQLIVILSWIQQTTFSHLMINSIAPVFASQRMRVWLSLIIHHRKDQQRSSNQLIVINQTSHFRSLDQSKGSLIGLDHLESPVKIQYKDRRWFWFEDQWLSQWIGNQLVNNNQSEMCTILIINHQFNFSNAFFLINT